MSSSFSGADSYVPLILLGTTSDHLFLLMSSFSVRFTPDFTSSRVIRELKLVTGGGSEFVFVLNASLPYHMLATCAESLPRPNWELELYIIVCLIMRSASAN